jgi:hypothetical protein
MIVLKEPRFENDDYLIRVEADKLSFGESAAKKLEEKSKSLASYYLTKRKAFLDKDTNPNIFQNFIGDRPSLRMLSDLERLDSTIYTVACEKQNGVLYDSLIKEVKKSLELKPSTRRCVVRFANDFQTYSSSERDFPSDVTCLNLLHYMKEGPRLVFRASDVKNELLVDLLTIAEFFIKPVYEDLKGLQVSIYSSTTQGVDSWQEFINSVEYLYEARRTQST